MSSPSASSILILIDVCFSLFNREIMVLLSMSVSALITTSMTVVCSRFREDNECPNALSFFPTSSPTEVASGRKGG